MLRQPELALPRLRTLRSRRDGTALVSLAPDSLIAAAEEDLRRRARNAHLLFAKRTIEHYAFHRAHVRRANNAAHLLLLASNGIKFGRKSGKRETRHIYRDKKALRAAMAKRLVES